jgi:hypothetical protein
MRPLKAQAVVSREISGAVALLNQVRRAAGLDTVAVSAKLSDGCKKHANYLAVNRDNALTSGLNAHKEYPQLVGYTKAGAAAGKNAVIHFVKPIEAFGGWMKTFYHRIPLLQPNLKEIGIGFSQIGDYTVTLLDCISGLVGESKLPYVCYPADHQVDIPLMMGPENPYPAPEKGDHGFPITIFFAQWQKVTSVRFELKDQTNKVIPCFVSSPEKPATFFDQWRTICAIPKQPLVKNMRYEVAVSCQVDGKAFEKVFEFFTIKS